MAGHDELAVGARQASAHVAEPPSAAAPEVKIKTELPGASRDDDEPTPPNPHRSISPDSPFQPASGRQTPIAATSPTASSTTACIVVKSEPPVREILMGSMKRKKGSTKSKSSTPSSAPSPSPQMNGTDAKDSNEKRTASPPHMPKFDPAEAPDATEEALMGVKVLEECTYQRGRRLANADIEDGDVMTCECRPEWDGEENHACGEDSGCINRATHMECSASGSCGADCQNMRFQRRQYANVCVIKADKKGYGLRADESLMANQFICEYVGEVVDEVTFRDRMTEYDQAGIKHFYFMSLGGGAFIDATRKGNLGRFCNHSCNPNCYVDKWVVAGKLRMGIFAKRDIRKGEELVFDYNVDRYGADPQVCYCGEPSCVGFIGGKTQTDAAPHLSHHIIEALGLESESALAGPKKRRPKKNDDEDYVETGPSKELTESGVTKVMSTLLHCKEKWIIHKLLSRIIQSSDPKVYPQVVRLHGYEILGRILNEYMDDEVIVLMGLDVLTKFPRITKNKITSSKIEPTVIELSKSSNEEVCAESKTLLAVWSELQTAFRIRRVVGGPVNKGPHHDRRDNQRQESQTPEAPAPPTGPRSNKIQMKPMMDKRPHPKWHPRDLPWGWHKAIAPGGREYYWANDGTVSWWKPKPGAHCNSNIKRTQIPSPPWYPYEEWSITPDFDDLRRYEEQLKAKVEKEQTLLRIRREQQESIKARLEEQKRKEEEERAAKKEKAKKRAEHDKRKRREKLEREVKSTITKISGKYACRYQDQLGSDFKKWHSQIVDALAEKTLKAWGTKIDMSDEAIKTRCKKLYERSSLDRIKTFIAIYLEKVIARSQGRAVKPTPTPNGTTPSAIPSASTSTSPTPQSKRDDSPPTDHIPPDPSSIPPLVVPSSPLGKKRGREDEDAPLGTAESPKRFKTEGEAQQPTPPPTTNLPVVTNGTGI